MEETTTEEDSDYWSSDDYDQHHIRKDNCSSAEEENSLKDMLRRNAREERDAFKYVKDLETERKKDLKFIEKCKIEKNPIPDDLK